MVIFVSKPLKLARKYFFQNYLKINNKIW